MSGSFAPSLLDPLRAARTVRVETARAQGGPVRETTIWIVVDESERVLVRSVRGGRGRWYRDLRGHPTGVLVVGSSRLEVRAELANDPERVAACSHALATKYARSGASLASMLTPEVLEFTLELHPA